MGSVTNKNRRRKELDEGPYEAKERAAKERERERKKSNPLLKRP